jgi:threonine/homoserine/homoserine lactone efflux protein
VPASHVLAFAAVSLLLIAVPGPSVLFVIGRSISLGRRGGLLSVLGNGLGVVPPVALVALGLGTIVAGSEPVLTVVKLLGAAYLVLLGVQTIRHRRAASAALERPTGRPRRVVLQGFLVGLTNPKTLVFLAAVLPQFVVPEAGAVQLQLALLGAIHIVIGFVSDGVWALVAGTARTWFARSPKRVERLDATGGVMMIGLGGVLALTGSSK